MLLSADSLCTDPARCIAIELKSSKVKESLALPYHTQLFRKCLMVYGTIGTYFNKNGLRNVSAGHWMDGFDVSTIDPHPEEWGDDGTINF